MQSMVNYVDSWAPSFYTSTLGLHGGTCGLMWVHGGMCGLMCLLGGTCGPLDSMIVFVDSWTPLWYEWTFRLHGGTCRLMWLHGGMCRFMGCMVSLFHELHGATSGLVVSLIVLVDS